MKTMLEEVMRVGARCQQDKLGQERQKVRCFRSRFQSSVGGGGEDTAGGYRSGALSSDDEFVSLGAWRNARSDYGDLRGCIIAGTSAAIQPDSASAMVVPSPGYSVGDMNRFLISDHLLYHNRQSPAHLARVDDSQDVPAKS